MPVYCYLGGISVTNIAAESSQLQDPHTVDEQMPLSKTRNRSVELLLAKFFCSSCLVDSDL